MILDIAVYRGTQRIITVPTYRAKNWSIKHNKHGFGSLEFECKLSIGETALFYANQQVLTIKVWSVTQLFYGRLEDPTITDQTVKFVALGSWRSFSDLPYTAFWSDTKLDNWRTITSRNWPITGNDKLYNFDTDNRLAISLKKGNTYQTSNDVGGFYYQVPSQSLNGIVGYEFTLKSLMPTNWTLTVQTWNDEFLAGASTLFSFGLSTLGIFTIAFNLTCTSAPVLAFFINNTSGSNYTETSEDGIHYTEIAAVRVVGSTATRVNTTLTAARAAGTSVTATVGSTTNMYAGQKLMIAAGSGTSEVVTVQSVTNATQFVATFANSYAIGQFVNAHNIDSSEIISHMIGQVAATNPTQLHSSTALVQRASVDILNAVYEDADMSQVADQLATIGNASTPYEVGVARDQITYFRPIGNTSRVWHIVIDLVALSIQTSLDTFYNSAYPVYKDVIDRQIRDATVTDLSANSNIIRRLAVAVNTTNATVASNYRNLVLADSKISKPRASVKVLRAYTRIGTLARIEDISIGDTVIVKNIPPTMQGTSIDRFRSFQVAELELNESGLILTPETPLRQLDYLIAVNALTNRENDLNIRQQPLQGKQRGR